jgi:hypothetical protein
MIVAMRRGELEKFRPMVREAASAPAMLDSF